MFIELTFLQPLVMIQIAHKRYGITAEIQRVTLLVHHHFHRVGTEKLVRVLNAFGQGCNLRIVAANQLDDLVDLGGIDEGFIALYVDHGIVLAFSHIQSLPTTVGAATVLGVG